MFFTAWYLCNAMKLTAADSRTVLRIADGIENREMPIAQRNAVTQTIAKMDSLVGAAFVPFLVENLRAESARTGVDDIEGQILIQEYYENVENAILQFLGGNVRQTTINIVEKLHEADNSTVLDYIRAVQLTPLEHHEGFTPYQDADLYVKESFVLALLVSVGESEPTVIEELVSGESELEIIQLARKGALGQVCWNLSMRLRFIMGEIPAHILRSFPNRWQERPDLVELVIPYLFPPNMEDSKDDLIFEEACSLELFTKYWRYYRSERTDSFWLWQDAGEGDCTRASIVMWQHILWNTVFSRNPGRTIRSLQGLWIAPTFRRFMKDETPEEYRSLTRYQKYMLPHAVKIERDNMVNIYICSPWQRRTEHIPDDSAGTEGNLFHAFRDFKMNYNALKAFCAVRLLRRIMQYAKKDINVSYITLFLNLGDAFSCFGARNTFELMEGRGNSEIRTMAWTAPIRMLGFYANGIIDEIGTGRMDANVPEEIMLKIKNRSPYFGNVEGRRITNPQILLVYRFSGLFCTARWVLLALRDHSVHHDGAVSPWLKGEPESYAVRLVNYLYVLKEEGYILPKASLELFYAMTEIERSCRYELGNLNFSNWDFAAQKVKVEDLVLNTNPSVTMWNLAGALTQEHFPGEAYVIALTNRLRALLESDLYEEGGQWYGLWKQMMEDVKTHPLITHVARLTLLRLLYVKPEKDENIPTLKRAMNCILDYFAEEPNDSPIYYHTTVARRLIELDHEMGPREIVKMRGDFAVQLCKRCRETEKKPELYEKWRSLYFHYLWGIKDNLCSSHGDTARNQIMGYWDSYMIRRENLRTFVKNRREWNPIQDRFWWIKQEKLLAVGNHLDTAMRFGGRYAINDQFRNASEEYRQWVLGIVAETPRFSEKREYLFYLGNGTKAAYKPVYFRRDGSRNRQKTYHVGDVLGVRMNEKGKIAELKDLGGLPALGGDIEAEEVCIKALEIDIHVMEGEEVYYLQDAEELFALWSGDTVAFLEQGKQTISSVKVSYCEYDNEKYGWIPKERDFDELMLRHLVKDGEQDNEISLTYLKLMGENQLLFSISAGENYALRRECFIADTWDKIRQRLFNGAEQRGMRIRMHLTEESGFPKLELSEGDVFDDVNIRWAELFNKQKPFQIQYNDRQWILDCEMPDVRPFLQASVVRQSENRRLIQSNRYNVEVAENGWTLREMRVAAVKVTLLQTIFLDPRISYDEFKMLVDLEPGMVFRLGRVLEAQPRCGYRAAFLDNHLRVSCADESLSFQTKRDLEKLGKGRLCIVDNVKETEPDGLIPDDMAGCWPECLAGIGNPVKGVLATYAPRIEMESENIEKLKFRVFLDIEGDMKTVDVPLHAFWPYPDNLGDRIDAVKTSSGWIFKVTKRDIVNVRALWQLEDHRGDENIQVTGEPLGTVTLARGTVCTMTQDEGSPILHAYDSDLDYAHNFKVQCGIKPKSGRVQFRGVRFSDRHCFPWAFRTDIVELKSGSELFVGEARQGVFTDGRAGWNVHAEVHGVYTENSRRYYDLRRVFTKTGSMNMESPQDEGKKEEWIREYKKWYYKGERHVSASAIGPLEVATKVLLRDLRVPEDVNGELEKAEFKNVVELETDHESIVRGRKYREDDIRVRLKLREGKWVASVKDVEAWNLDETLVEHFGLKSGMHVKRTFYYAGRDEAGNMIFEWGVGNFFKARTEDVTDTSGGTFAYELFFGDSVRAVTFVADPEGEYNWRVRIRREDIYHEVEGLVWLDTNDNIIQLLKVKKDSRTGRVNVRSVSVYSRYISDLETNHDGWQFRDTHSAFLSHDSQSKLQNEIRTEHETVVFAHVNKEVSGKEKRDQVFDYISLNAADGQLRLLENKILCLTAHTIQETGDVNHKNRITNDYRINFYLPGELPDECENPRLVMNVNRRKFSFDESRLRLDVLSNPDKYLRSNMLVSLGELSTVDSGQDRPKTYYWNGSVISAPKHPLESLKQWLTGVHSCLATLSTLGYGEGVYAEIVPGIICDVTEACSNLRIKRGSGTLARLSLENDGIRVRVILSGDSQYFSEKKRPVELLIMDGILNHYNRILDSTNEEKDSEDKEPDFTIAGFPQIILYNKSLGKTLIRGETPRFGMVCLDKQKKLMVEANDRFDAGYLKISKKDFSPILDIITPEAHEIVGAWHQMTFQDGTVSEIVNNVRDGKWHYHDRYTGQYIEDKRKVIRHMLPDGKDFRKIVTFFAPGGRLRYTRQELEVYGMSARELVEHGLPRNDRWYSIAGGSAQKVWLELFPGKVVDISADYLMAGSGRCRLSELCMTTFGPGDEMWLADDSAYTGGQHGILMMDFRFSGRDAAKAFLTVLPVVDVLADGVVLGGGIFRFKYPMVKEEAVKHYKGEAVILDSQNALTTSIQFQNLKTGAVVYISLDERNRMFIPGMEDVQVSPAFEGLWTNTEWLFSFIKKDIETAFHFFENYIPLTITQIDPKNRKIWVAYQQKRIPTVCEGQALAVNCIGMLPKLFEVDRVILRSGSYLFLVDGENILSGVDSYKLRRICGRLSELRTGFFMTKTTDGWKNGLSTDINHENIDIRLLCSVPEIKGFVARNRRDFSLKYLPVQASCRVRTDATEKVWDALMQRPERVARLMEKDIISLIDEHKSEENYHALLLMGSEEDMESFYRISGGFNARVIPRVFLEEDSGYYNYLSELYPMGDIILLKSEYAFACEKETDPISVEIIECHKNNVVVVPAGERRQRIHLSKWFIEAMRNNYYRDYGIRMDSRRDINTMIFQDSVPKRFKSYKSIRDHVLKAADKWLNVELLKDDTRLNESLVYLYSKMLDKSVDIDYLNLQCAFVLVNWLSEPGRSLSSGFNYAGKTNMDMDLIPIIAAIGIMDKININGNDRLKRLSVHLARMLGYACGLSIHEEQIINEWIYQKRYGEQWGRLRHLSLGGETLPKLENGGKVFQNEHFDGLLSPSQHKAIVENADSILRLNTWDKQLRNTVYSLLLSVADVRDYSEFFKRMSYESYCTVKLAPMGRLLTPAFGRVSSFAQLPDEMRTLLNDVFKKHTGCCIELCTNTYIPLDEEECKYWNDEVNGCVALLKGLISLSKKPKTAGKGICST